MTVGNNNSAMHDPIAIVGIGCRFPGGANDPKSYWKLLTDGIDAISEVPEDRWNIDTFFDPTPGTPGKSYSKWGGFVDGISEFEPACFGISPREAVYMDPQQRLLLEVAWEAIEDAGRSADELIGTDTGVFVGVSISDYNSLQGVMGHATETDPHTATGSALSITANRISYCLNLIGPSMAVDTACSSSLVAVDLACRRIQRGDCRMALAGGVNLMLTPSPFLAFSSATMLSADGRCKTFDARADGFVRGEGAGIVMLKSLSDAQADGDPIYALITGTGANQDGRTSGIAMPSESSQASLIRDVCKTAGISPSIVDYVEAHGTGTAVGDPIEARALGQVLGADRDDGQQCILGSVKTNIGHLESAAGIAGLIKAVLVLQNGQVPKHLHFENLNPAIPLQDMNMRIPSDLEDLPRNGRPAIAAVNSFGFGGTNAHAILQQFSPAEEDVPDFEPSRPFILPLSARTPESLKSVAKAYVTELNDTDYDEDKNLLADLCYTTAVGRVARSHRAAIVARSTQELRDHLDALQGEDRHSNTVTGEAKPGKKRKVAFIFSGQGPQWFGMGQQLFAAEPVFRDVITQCDALMKDQSGWSLIEEMSRDEASSKINQTQFAQPALFALQVALARLLQSWGVEPTAVVGHSVGEIAAAHISGALSLANAAKVAVHRGRTMDRATSLGRMLAVSMTLEEAKSLIAPDAEHVSIAAVNSPSAITLSGNPETLERIEGELTEKSIFNKFLEVEYAFHSPQMAPVEEALAEALADLTCEKIQLPMISTVTGKSVSGTELDHSYWWRNVRETVRFTDAFKNISDDGYDIFIEISPHPVMSSAMQEILLDEDGDGQTVSSLRRQEDEQERLLCLVGSLFAMGVPVDWEAICPGPHRRVHAPTYPWHRETFWHEADEVRKYRIGRSVHPLLGHRQSAADPTWRGKLDLRVLKYLEDHRVRDVAVFPGAGYIEMALAMSQEVIVSNTIRLDDLRFRKVLHLPSGQSGPNSSATYHAPTGAFSISSGSGDETEWILHATGYLRPDDTNRAPKRADFQAMEARLPNFALAEEGYRIFTEAGLTYGPAFQGVTSLHFSETEALALVELPEGLDDAAYNVHPSLLDACFQVSAVLHPQLNAGVFLPVHLESFIFHKSPGQTIRPHVVLREINEQIKIVDIDVYDETGALIIELKGFVLQATMQDRSDQLEKLLYTVNWYDQPLLTSKSDDIPPRIPAVDDLIELISLKDRDVPKEGDTKAKLTNIIEAMAAAYDRVDELAFHYIVDAFQEMGLPFQIGQTINRADVTALSVISDYNRLIAHYIEILVSAGYLTRTEDENVWQVAKTPQSDASDEWRSLLFEYPAYIVELSLLGRFGSRLADVLQGTVDPLELLFPDGSSSLAEFMYRDSPSCYQLNRALRHIVEAHIGAMPKGKKLRILEIGGGTGGLTSHVIPVVPPHRSDYLFTDISPGFFSDVEGKMRGYDFIEYKALDIEKGPDEQDIELGSFDIILASNVLHATENLTTSLGNVKKMLKPGGLLAFMELANAPPWFDVVFGLMKGWWRFTDHDLRPNHPLLSRSQWHDLLAKNGFSDVGSIPVDDNATQIIAWAQGPSEIAPASDVGQLEDGTAEEIVNELSLEDAGSWIVLADGTGIGERIADRMRKAGHECFMVRPGEDYFQTDSHNFTVAASAPADFEKLLGDIYNSNAEIRGVLHLWSLDFADLPALDLNDLQNAESVSCHGLMHLIQANENSPDRLATYDLLIVTRGAQSIDGKLQITCLPQAELLGMGRVLCNEHTDIACKMLDLSPRIEGSEIFDDEIVLSEILATDGEEEVAIRGAVRYVPRVEHDELEQISSTDLGTGKRYIIDNQKPGVLDRMTAIEANRTVPGPDEVEIEVVAVGLNFRDVLKALDLYPKDSPDSATFGDECAGVIVNVGSNVEDFAIGDEVVAFATGSLASHVTTPTAGVIRKPAHLSFHDAVTMPVPFLTAIYALHSTGRIQSGESILIHAATGGVGLAALQIAEKANASIFTTAGNTQKRDFLRLYGIEHIMNSRTLAFADEIADKTDGRGVDLVLNALAGKAISKGLESLAPYGRFLEIGKRDIYEDSQIGLWPFHKCLSFLVIDLSRVLSDGSSASSEILGDFAKMIWDRTIHPLPYRIFPTSEVTDAMRYMGQAKHIGKIVIATKDLDAKINRPIDSDIEFDAEATYILTGGFGGLGLEVAHWIIDNGGSNIVLMGRSGAKNDEARGKITNLRSKGAKVLEAHVDVSDPKALQIVLDDIRSSMPPIKGIFHAAMVIDDGAVVQLNSERFRRTTAPKSDGAWNLHSLTIGDDLDFFVMFSSMSSMGGQQGQANYAAANTFLDTLAHYRRDNDLPALSINWGAVSDVGFVAESDKYSRLLEMSGLTSKDVLEALGYLMRRNPVQTGVLRADWRAIAAAAPAQKILSRLSVLVSETPEQSNAEGGGEFRKTILAAPKDERLALLQDYFREQVGQIIGLGSGKLANDQPLMEVGLDSLMALELRVQIEKDLLVALPIAKLMQGPVTIESLSIAIAGLMLNETPESDLNTEKQSDTITVSRSASLVPLQPMGDGSTLFCIHPAGGRLTAFDDLSKSLGTDNPVFGIEAAPTPPDASETVEEMATTYANLIRDQQPSGPYHIVGFSFGGFVAMSVAAALEADGETVTFLGLIDPQGLSGTTDRSFYLANILSETYVEAHRQIGKTPPVSNEQIIAETTALTGALDLYDEDGTAEAILEWVVNNAIDDDNVKKEEMRWIVESIGRHVRMVINYQPPIVQAPLDIWLAKQSAFGGLDTDWAPFTQSECHLETLNVEHYDIVRPPAIELIANVIKSRLSD